MHFHDNLDTIVCYVFISYSVSQKSSPPPCKLFAVFFLLVYLCS